MDILIAKMKILLTKLERAALLNQQSEVVALAEKIEHIAVLLKNKESGDGMIAAKLPAKNKKASFTVQAQFKQIETVDFLYKPVLVGDPYQGDYLIRFNRERTAELKSLGLLEIHNQFWLRHEVLRANVFGALPMTNLGTKDIQALLSKGWDRTKVTFLELKNKLSDADLVEQIQNKYNAYIIVEIKEEQRKLLLAFDWSA